jgi:hypothetical protein
MRTKDRKYAGINEVSGTRFLLINEKFLDQMSDNQLLTKYSPVPLIGLRNHKEIKNKKYTVYTEYHLTLCNHLVEFLYLYTSYYLVGNSLIMPQLGRSI